MSLEPSEQRCWALLQHGAEAHLQGRFAEAEQRYRAAREIAETACLSDLWMADCAHRLACLYLDSERVTQAEPLCVRAVELARAFLAPDRSRALPKGPTATYLALFLTTLGRLRNHQGRTAEAEQLLKEALAIQEKVSGITPEGLANILLQLVNLYGIERRYDEQEAALERLSALQEQTAAADPVLALNVLCKLGRSHYCRGRLKFAEQFLKRSLDAVPKGTFLGSAVSVRSLYQLADVYQGQGRDRERSQTLQQALQLAVKTFGRRHTEVAECLERLASLCREQERYGRALRYANEALALREQIHGPEHEVVARDLHDLGLIYFAWEKYDRAEEFFRRALAVARKALGPHHPDLVAMLRNLGAALARKDCLEEAVRLFGQALMLREELSGPNDPRTVATRKEYADLLRSAGRAAEAAEVEARAAGAEEPEAAPTLPLEAAVPASTPDAADLARRWAELREEAGRAYDRGDLDRAGELLQSASEIAGQFDVLDWRAGWTLCLLSNVCRDRNRLDEAERYGRRGLVLLEQAQGAEGELVAKALQELAVTALLRGDAPGAEGFLRRSLTICEKSGGPQHPQLMPLLCLLGRLLEKHGRQAEAVPLARRAVTVAEGLVEIEAGSLHHLLSLAELCDRLDERGAADLAYRRHLAERERLHGPEHLEVMRAAFAPGRWLGSLGRWAEAEPLLRQAAAIGHKLLKDDNWEMGWLCYWLASACDQLENGEEARQLAREAASIARAARGDLLPPPKLLRSLAGFCYDLGEIGAAEQVARRRLAELERQQGPEPTDLFDAAFALGRNLDEQQRWDEAEPFLRRAASLGRRLLADNDWERGRACYWLASACEKLDRRDEAGQLAREAASIAEAAPTDPAPHPNPLRGLAALCDRLGEIQAAELAYRRCLAELERLHGLAHPDILPVLGDWAALLTRGGRRAEAAQLFLRRLDLIMTSLPPTDPSLGDCLGTYVDWCIAQSDYLAGMSACLSVCGYLEKNLGCDHLQVAAVLERHAAIHRRIGNSLDASRMEARAGAIRARQRLAAQRGD